MKRILAPWLAAMLIAVQPCYAVVMVGFGQSEPSADFCGGTDTFCTSWETGTGAQNTSPSSNEDTFDAVTGTLTKLSSGCAVGTACVQGEYGSTQAYVKATNGGTGFGSNAVTVSGYFRFDDENSGASNVVVIYESAAWYEVARIERSSSEVVTDDNTVPVNVKIKLTSSTATEVQLNINLTEDVWYKYTIVYNQSTNTASCDIKTTSDTSVYSSGNLSLTVDPGTIEEVWFGNAAYGKVSHDGVKIQ